MIIKDSWEEANSGGADVVALGSAAAAASRATT